MTTHFDPKADPIRQRRQQVAVASQAQREAAAAKQLAGLQAMRDKLIKEGGVMPGALPQLSSAMSAVDMEKAATRMAGIDAANKNAGTRTPAPAATGAAGPVAAAGSVGQPPAVVPVTPAVAAPGEKTPLETALATVPNHQGMTVDARQTGAGMVTTFPGSGGPHGFGARDIAVNPTFEQIMHAKTGGQWQAWTPAQRAQWLRSNPAQPPLNADNAGVVTDPGRTAPDVKGVSTLQTPSGVVQEYDPRNDQVNSVGGITGPAAVTRSIEERYGSKPDGSVSRGSITAPAPNPISPATVSNPYTSAPAPVSDNPKPAVPSAVDDKNDLGDFLQNEHDDQFKKGLVFQGFNDGVAV